MGWGNDRAFWRATIIVAGVLVAIVYGQVFLGKVPFPAWFVFEYPTFASAAPATHLQVPANIGDLVSSFYPYRMMAARAVRDGEVPLWNPYFLAGTPFLASSQSAVFYPLTVPYYLLSVPTAWSLGFLIRPFLAIFFMALFVRAIGGTITGSLVSGILFAFCGFLTAWQGMAMHDAAIWLPLACFGIIRLHERWTPARTILCAIAFAMPVLAGHPETAALVTATAVAMAGFLAVTQWSWSFVLGFTAAGIMSVGLAAVQILPTVEWLRYAHHSLVDGWPPHPLWSILGWVSRDILHTRSSFGLQVPEQATYMGMLAFAAAPLALLHRSRKLVVFLAGWSAISFSIAYGLGPFFWLSRQIPILQALKNERLIFIAAFGLAALAGLGISAMEKWDAQERTRLRARALLLLFAGSTIALALVYALRVATLDMSEPSRFPRVSAILLVLSAMAIALGVAGKLRGLPFKALILIIVSVDMVSFTYGFMPFTDRADLFPRFEIFERLPRTVEPYRITTVGGAYLANVEAVYGLSGVGGYEVCLQRIKDFTDGLASEEMDAIRLISGQILAERDRRFDMLNARYLVVSQWDPLYLEYRKQTDRFRLAYSTRETDIFENLHALPAAFLVPFSGIEVIPDSKAAMQRIKDPSFDPTRNVISESPLAGAPWRAQSVSLRTGGQVEWTARTANHFELDVTAEEHSVLVVSQIFYPGWEARVNGKAVEVVPVDHALTGITLPPGRHHVQFVFRSPSFRLGLGITGLSVLILLTLGMAPLIRPSLLK